MSIASTPESEPFWEHAARDVLALPYCLACEQPFFYPRQHCPLCFAQEIEWRPVSGEGRLASYIIVTVAPPGWEGPVPYVVALVELAEGPRMMSDLVGVEPAPDTIEIGMPLTVTFDHDGPLTRPLFRPAPDAA